VRDALAPQDGLYSLSVQDEVPAIEIVGSVREVLVVVRTRR
jgi:fructuronate reductase